MESEEVTEISTFFSVISEFLCFNTRAYGAKTRDFFQLVLFRESSTELHKHNHWRFLGFTMGLLRQKKKKKRNLKPEEINEIGTSRKKKKFPKIEDTV